MELYDAPIQYAQLMKSHGPEVFALEGVQEVERAVVRGMIEYVVYLPEGVDIRDTPDFKRYGLIPGQEICHIGAFTGPLVRSKIGDERYRQLTAEGQEPQTIKESIMKVLASAKHCGVYIGGGMIAEVGGTFLVPDSSYKKGYFVPKGAVQRFCLSTLADFKTRAEKTIGTGLIVMESPIDNRIDVVLARLMRALHVMGDPLTYSLVASNCQYFSGYVSFGTWWSQNQLSQAAWAALLAVVPERVRIMVESGALASAIDSLTAIQQHHVDIEIGDAAPRGRIEHVRGDPRCVPGTCEHRPITNNGCACVGPVRRGITGSWCSVNGSEIGCKPAGMDKDYGEWGWFSGVTKSCKSAVPPGGYVECL